MMYVEITVDDYQNHFGRLVPRGSVIGVPEIKGRKMIQDDVAVLSHRNPVRDYHNRLNAMKSQKDFADQPDERKSTWFGRLLGI